MCEPRALWGIVVRERLTRICVLLEALRGSRRGLTIAAIEERTGASRSTVYRDLAVLRDAGLEPVAERVNGEVRRRLPGEVFAKYDLSSHQVSALRLARETLAPLEGTRLLATLDSLVQARSPTGAAVTAHKVRPAHTPTVVAQLEAALSRRLRVDLLYRGMSDEAGTVRRVDPGALHVRDGQLYFWAWALDRDDWRTFKVARIASVTVLDVPAVPHPGLEKVTDLSRAVRVWSGDPVDVTVRLAAPVARLASEYPLVAEQTVEARPDGAVLVHATVAGLVETVRWVLSWGRHAAAVAPDELVDAMRDELQAALDQYETDDPRGVSRMVRQSGVIPRTGHDHDEPDSAQTDEATAG